MQSHCVGEERTNSASPGRALADGGAGFYAGCAEQTSDLLEVKLDGIGAENLGLRKIGAGVANLSHAIFEASNVGFQVEVGRRDLKTPAVNAFGDVLKA
jgi:hypothetical protein